MSSDPTLLAGRRRPARGQRRARGTPARGCLATRCARGSAPCRRRRQRGAGGPAGGGRRGRAGGRREPGRPECVRRPRSDHVPARALPPASCGSRAPRPALTSPPSRAARSSSADARCCGPEVSEWPRGPGVRLSLGGPGARPGHPPHPHPGPRPGLCAGDPPEVGGARYGAWDARLGWGATRAGMPGRWPGGGRGPSRCWGRGTPGPGSRREGAAAGRDGGQRPLGTPRRPPPASSRRCGAGARRPAGGALRLGLPFGGAGRRRPGRRVRQRGASAETEERAPEAWAGARMALGSAIALAASRLLRGIQTSKMSIDPLRFLLRSWLNIFFPLKGGGGVSGEGCERLGAGARDPAGDPRGLCLQGGAAPLGDGRSPPGPGTGALGDRDGKAAASEDAGTRLVPGREVGRASGDSPAPGRLFFSAQVIALPWGPSPAALARSGGGSVAKFD